MRNIIILLLLISVSSTFIRCKSTQPIQQQGVEIDSLIVVDSFQYNNDSAYAMNSISIHIDYPKAIEGVDDLSGLMSIIASTLNKSSNTPLSIHDVTESMKANFRRSVEEDCIKAEKNVPELLEMGAFEDNVVRLHGCVNNIFSFEFESMTYTMGAAHPNTTVIYKAVDLKTNSVIKTSDFIDESNIQAVGSLIKEQLAIYFECDTADLSDLLFVSEITPNDNFIISPTGVTWLYNRYEIAPYAAGAPTAFIPFTTLSYYIKPNSVLSSFVNGH